MMRRFFAIAIGTAALAGCATSPPALPVGSAVATVNQRPLPFWVPTENAPADALEHPCGAYVMRSVERLPVDDTGAFGTEWVVEFSAEGRELARWPSPVDFLPESIDGGRLLLVDYKDVALWVETDGTYSVAPVARTTGPRIDCPVLERFGDSAYLQCTTLRDRTSGAERRIAHQGVCS